MTNAAALPTPMPSGLGANYLGLTEKVTNSYHHDSFRVAGNAPLPREIQLFRIPQGRAGSGFGRAKTYAETSLTLAGKLERPATITEIRYELLPVGAARTAPATAQYLLALRASLHLIFKVKDSDAVGPRPICHYPELGWSGTTNMAAATPEAVIGGVPTSRAERLSVWAPIPGGVGFSVDLVPDQNMAFLGTVPAGADFIVTVYLGGTSQQISQN